jgi:hypothetical protein
MTPERRAEIGAIADTQFDHAAWYYIDVIHELLAEIDRLNSERTSMIEHHAFRWLPEQHHPAEVGQSNGGQHANADHDSSTAKLDRDEGVLPPGES